MIRHPALLLGAIMLLAGCGESAESSVPVAGMNEIAGPYLTEPYRAYDQAMMQKLDEECITTLADDRLELLLADGRGGGRIFLIYSGPDGMAGECFASIDAERGVRVEGGGTSSGNGLDLPGPLEVRPMSGGSSGPPDSWGYLRGAAGSDISRVVIELPDGTGITASLSAGNFAAWWAGQAKATRIRGIDASGNEVVNEPY